MDLKGLDALNVDNLTVSSDSESDSDDANANKKQKPRKKVHALAFCYEV